MDMPDLHIICGWAAQPEVKANVCPWLLCLLPLIQIWFLLAPKTHAAQVLYLNPRSSKQPFTNQWLTSWRTVYSQVFCPTRLPGRLPFSWNPTSCLPGQTENPAGLCSSVQGPGLDTPALKSSVGVAVWMEELVLGQAAPYWNDLKLVLTSRRRLGTCPQLNMMDELQLLSLQHNGITKIQHLSHLHNLVFLNLSDNNISEMTGLEALGSLRVLMLGQNRWVRPGRLPTAEHKTQHQFILVASPEVWLSSFRMDVTNTENCPSQ